MSKRVLLLGFAMLGLAAPAGAEEKYPSLGFAVDGSLPLQWASNIDRVSKDRHADYDFAPYLKLLALGDLRSDVSYSLYASTSADRYFSQLDSIGSVGAFGGDISKRWGPLHFTVSYERGYYYDQYFGSLLNAANDFSFSLRYLYVNPAADLRIKPGVLVQLRADESLTTQRNLYVFKINVERKVADRWWLLFTPQMRFYNYMADRSGRRDVMASVFTGLKYVFNDNINLTMGAGYEDRSSNTDGKNYTNWTLGASLDFSFDLKGDSTAFNDWLKRTK